MKYRLGFPLLIIAVIACIGIASAKGGSVLADTVLDIFNASAPSGSGKQSSDIADLSKSQSSQQGERRSSGGSGGATTLPAGAFQDFFEVAQAGNFSDVTASLTFPQDSEYYSDRARGFASALRSSPSSFSGSSGSFSSGSSAGGSSGSVRKVGGSNGADSSGGVGSVSSGGSGGSDGGNTNGLPQTLLLASLMTGQNESESGGSTPNPASIDDSGILPKVTEIPQPAFVPQQDDPLLGAPLREVIPGPEDNRNPDPAPIPNPEPGTLILGGMGLAIMAFARRRMKSRQGE